jgi:DNA-binding NarL/FixJ family response regulator
LAADNARRTGAPIHQTLSLLVTAWALIGQHRHDAAARAARQAVEEFSARGYVLLAARARIAYADGIQRSDQNAAEKALRDAAATFDEIGAATRHQEVRSRLRQLDPPRRSTASTIPGLWSLTRRERQVAALAAGGYTAAQIATQLHIGVRTVETHLARSYPKLGITCKQQLVHRAAELGFTPGP